MSVIIHGKDKPFGVLGTHTTKRRVFTKDDINFLQAVANVLAAAIERNRAYERGEYVKLSITDSGAGIAPEILDKIFEPFFTTKKMDRMRGSGLGLSVVHGIVEDHKGYITVDTVLGRSTNFSLYFPIARELVVAKENSEQKVKGGSEKILVVDDDPVQRRVIKTLLSRLGYQVNTLASGEEAVAFLKDSAHHLLILDMVMEGIDGTEAYRQILEYQPLQKAIILSGYAISERVLEARRLGAGSFIPKPILLEDLAAAVRRELDKAPA